MSSLGASSKLNTEGEFIDMLFEKGRSTAESWLAQHFKDIGKRSTINLRSLFHGDEDALDGDRISRPANFQKEAFG